VVADLAHAAEVQPEDTGIAALLGKAHYEAGNYRAALLQLRQTRKRDPGTAIAAELLPQLLFIAANEASRAEDAGEALRLVEELIMFQPTLENRMWRVRLLIARQRNTQARQELRNILYANPDYFPARDLLDRLR
jgi:tetratricopeptide (TPR) repeat protein